MNLLQSFLNHHLPTAKKYKELSKSLVVYTGEDKLFVIGLGNAGSIITGEKKTEILKQFNNTQKKIYFMSLFATKEDFQKNVDIIAWGSYVWTAAEPEHTIHFDDKPTIIARRYH
jgi:hypothetical protein